MSPAFIWANTWPWDSVGGVVDGDGDAIGDKDDDELLDGVGVVVVLVGVVNGDGAFCGLADADGDEEDDSDDDELLLCELASGGDWEELDDDWVEPCELDVDEVLLLDDADDGLLCELLDDGVLDEVEELCRLVVDDEEEPCGLLEEELPLRGLEPVDDWDELWEPVGDEEDDSDDDELLLCELAFCKILIALLRNCE